MATLVERVADGVTNGAIPPCKICNGRIDYVDGVYKCKGFLSSWSKVNIVLISIFFFFLGFNSQTFSVLMNLKKLKEQNGKHLIGMKRRKNIQMKMINHQKGQEKNLKNHNLLQDGLLLLLVQILKIKMP